MDSLKKAKETSLFVIIQAVLALCVLLSILDNASAAGAGISATQNSNSHDTSTHSTTNTAYATCATIGFMRKLGAPVMTGILVGSCIMAIFGRLQWHTIGVVVACTAIFFGAGEGVAEITAHRCV